MKYVFGSTLAIISLALVGYLGYSSYCPSGKRCHCVDKCKPSKCCVKDAAACDCCCCCQCGGDCKCVVGEKCCKVKK